MTTDEKSFGQIAYERFFFGQQSCSEWRSVHAATRSQWEACAGYVIDAYDRQRRHEIPLNNRVASLERRLRYLEDLHCVGMKEATNDHMQYATHSVDVCATSGPHGTEITSVAQDDDEPITEGWLVALGFWEINRGRRCNRFGLLSDGYAPGWWFYLSDDSRLRFPVLYTRRQLRLVCELLQIPLRDLICERSTTPRTTRQPPIA